MLFYRTSFIVLIKVSYFVWDKFVMNTKMQLGWMIHVEWWLRRFKAPVKTNQTRVTHYLAIAAVWIQIIQHYFKSDLH